MKRQTEIICTIGPASRSPETLQGLIQEGMNYARLNFSHGAAQEHMETASLVREMSHKMGMPVKIIQDLQGPKLRIGRLNHPVHFRTHDKVAIAHITSQRDDIPVAVPEILTHIRVGDRVFLDDGAVELEALEVLEGRVHCVVRIGGRIDSGSGIGLPDHQIMLPALSQKDIRDIEVGHRMSVDVVAQSMVRCRADVDLLKQHVGDAARAIAKIESVEALGDLDRIAEAVWGIMVARGDLGISIPRAQVPIWQKEILAICRTRKRYGIVATEMLISMVKNERPTRAEVSDVATAVFDGANAVMLSEETAIGAHPIDAVREMREVIETVETSTWFRQAAQRQ